MYTGSMRGAGPKVFAIWGYCIAHAVDGQIEINPDVVAFLIGEISPQEVCDVIKFLMRPDDKSRTSDQDGRRLTPVSFDGANDALLAPPTPGRADTYKMVNHLKYRGFRDEQHRRDYMREYMRGKRSKKSPSKNDEKTGENKNVNSCKQPLAQLAHTYADAEANTNTPLTPQEGGERNFAAPESQRRTRPRNGDGTRMTKKQKRDAEIVAAINENRIGLGKEPLSEQVA